MMSREQAEEKMIDNAWKSTLCDLNLLIKPFGMKAAIKYKMGIKFLYIGAWPYIIFKTDEGTFAFKELKKKIYMSALRKALLEGIDKKGKTIA